MKQEWLCGYELYSLDRMLLKIPNASPSIHGFYIMKMNEPMSLSDPPTRIIRDGNLKKNDNQWVILTD